jgi:hypothetical protein
MKMNNSSVHHTDDDQEIIQANRENSNGSINPKRQCFSTSPLPPFEVEMKVRVKYFMLNAYEDSVIGPGSHTLHRYEEFVTRGKSLIWAIYHILTGTNYAGTVPSEEELRASIVDQYHQDMRYVNTTKSMFYFQSGNDDVSTFRSKFIKLMREDREYEFLLNQYKRRHPLAHFIDSDEDREMELYINNKEQLTTELTLIDAIPICNHFNKNVITWQCNGDHNVNQAERSIYFNYVSGRETWILMYDQESKRYFTRNV